LNQEVRLLSIWQESLLEAISTLEQQHLISFIKILRSSPNAAFVTIDGKSQLAFASNDYLGSKFSSRDYSSLSSRLFRVWHWKWGK
jgi:7-keto-8-aminopelargonate synthetase-like enzyme